MRADLAQRYHLNIDDVWAGRVSAYHVIVLIGQLAADPHTRMYALAGGNPELQGWDANTVLAARTHNLIAGIVAGLGGKRIKLDDLLIDFPAPARADEAEEAEPKTLADFIAQRVDTGQLGDFFTP